MGFCNFYSILATIEQDFTRYWNQMRMKPQVRFIIFCVKCMVGISLLSTYASAFNGEPTKVTLQLSWFHQFQFAGYYIAKEKGYYKEAGLDVEILPFQFGSNSVHDVVAQKTDFAIGRETLIVERALNQKIVALYALFQTSPLIFITKESSAINSLHHFAGKRLMATLNDSSEVSLKAMLNSYHLKPQDYAFIEHSHTINDLIDGKVDIMSAYLSKAPFDLKEKGISYTIFHPKEYGFDMYSDFLYTNEALIKKNPKLVEAFKQASLKGWQYAYAHIEESAELILEKYNTQNLSKEALVYEGEELKKLSYYKTETLGKMDKNKLQRIYDLYNVMGYIPTKMKIEDFVQDRFGELSDTEKAYLEAKKEIKVCSDPNWMPFEKIENGKLKGLSVDYLNLIEPITGIPFTLVPTASWEESLRYAKERKCDIFSLAMSTPENERYMIYTKPYLSTPIVIATTNDKFFIARAEDILDKKIGVVKGYSLVALLKTEYPTIQLIEVKNIKDGLEKVARGELYGFVDSLMTVGYMIQKEYPNMLKIAGKLNQSWDMGFAARNDEPELAQILEKALRTLDENTQQSITTKWVNIRYENGFDYALFWQLAFIVLVLFILLMYRYRVMQRYNIKIKKHIEVIDQYVLFISANNEGIITNVSEALCQLSGYTKEELLGESETILNHPDVSTKVFETALRAALKAQTWEGELKSIKKNGVIYWVHARISPIVAKDGTIQGYNSFRVDITDKKRIEEISQTDQLTQIYNRLSLDQHYQKELLRASRSPSNLFSLILIDIDYFKDINDSYGHTMGDTILVELAQLIKLHIRSIDIFGRWGGEEFLIICPNTAQKEASRLAEKLRLIIEEHSFGTRIFQTCSFGVTQYQENDTKDSMFIRADKALYAAKTTGRNRVMTI